MAKKSKKSRKPIRGRRPPSSKKEGSEGNSVPSITIQKLKRGCYTCEEYRKRITEEAQKPLQPIINVSITGNTSEISQKFPGQGYKIGQPESTPAEKLSIPSVAKRTLRNISNISPAPSIVGLQKRGVVLPSEPIPLKVEQILQEPREIVPQVLKTQPFIKEEPMIPQQPSKDTIKSVGMKKRRLPVTKTPVVYEYPIGEGEVFAYNVPKEEQRGRPRNPQEGPINKPSEELLRLSQEEVVVPKIRLGRTISVPTKKLGPGV